MTLVLVELEKLRTVRSAWLLFLAGVLMPLPIAIVALAQAGEYSTMPQDLVNLVALPAAFAAALAATACAREFEHRTITVAFMIEPRRERVIAAKAVAACVLGLAMGTLFCALTLGLAAVWISSAGARWPWSGQATLHAVSGVIAVTALLAVAGTGFGGLVRHVGGSITLLIALYLGVDSVLGARFDLYRDWGLTAATNTLVEPTTAHHYGFPAALAIVLGSSLAYLALGIAAVRRADV
jgi:ABC-type transport system involved in multi-copper enzyme maturation permease subunit